LAYYLLVALADLTLELLAGDQFLVLRELELHFLGLQQVDMLLKQHTQVFEHFAEPSAGLREVGEGNYF
jgi:hypothetical protein